MRCGKKVVPVVTCGPPKRRPGKGLVWVDQLSKTSQPSRSTSLHPPPQNLTLLPDPISVNFTHPSSDYPLGQLVNIRHSLPLELRIISKQFLIPSDYSCHWASLLGGN